MDYPEKVKQAYNKVRGPSGAIRPFEAKVPYPDNGDRWGNWKFHAERLRLVYSTPHGRHRREVDLHDMTSSARMLDWIFQRSMKTWASRKDIGDLVQALDDLLHPQANLCSKGVDKRFDAGQFLREHLRTGARRPIFGKIREEQHN